MGLTLNGVSVYPFAQAMVWLARRHRPWSGPLPEREGSEQIRFPTLRSVRCPGWPDRESSLPAHKLLNHSVGHHQHRQQDNDAECDVRQVQPKDPIIVRHVERPPVRQNQ